MLMKLDLFVISLVLLISIPSAFAARGQSYGTCDAPLSNYKCYNTDETPYCPESGLEYVKGWCKGGNEIQCCAPPKTPEGVGTGGPGIITQSFSATNLKTGDFELFLEGTLSCAYKVASNGKVTKESSFPCDSFVTIKVGPNGECKDEGIDACQIVNDGGYLGRTKTYTFSIQFKKPAKTYGNCRKYTSSLCMDVEDCKTLGGKSVRYLCPGLRDNIRCCKQEFVPEESEKRRSALLFENTKEKTLKDTEKIESRLAGIKKKYNVRIIMEITDDFPQQLEKSLRDKYYLLYEADKDSTTSIDMLLIYGKAKDAWRGIGVRNCRINENKLRMLLSDKGIKEKITSKDYDAAFERLAILLEDEVAAKINSGDFCKDSSSSAVIVKRVDCSKECNSWSLVGSCSLEKCVNIDGCVWDDKSSSCENICGQNVQGTEVVVLKRSDGCVNAENCPNLYVCKNGELLEGYPVSGASGAAEGTKIKRGDLRTPEGEFEILEKIKILQVSDSEFKYFNDQDVETQPKCNLDPRSTSIRDYWLHISYPDKENAANPNDPRGSCIGLHGSTRESSPTLGCIKVVDKEELATVFRNAEPGTKVTIKDPFRSEEEIAQISESFDDTSENIITAAAVGQTQKRSTFSKVCQAVCGDWYSSLKNWVGLGDCKKRCEVLGCAWEGDKCMAVRSYCPIPSQNRIQEVLVVSSVNEGTPDDKNKIVAYDDAVKLYAVAKIGNDWVTNADISKAVIKRGTITPKRLNQNINVKWYQIEPELGHLEWNGVNLEDAGCFGKNKLEIDACNICPDIFPKTDENYCWNANPSVNPSAKSPFWYRGADLIVYNQFEYGTGWTVDAESTVGTLRYRVEATFNGRMVSSPGAPDPSRPHKLKEQFYRAGITNDVHRISRRSDFDVTCPDPFKGSEGCKYMSYLHSYALVPWVWGSYTAQRDNYIGFDCADLAGGAYKQMTGKTIETSAQGLATGTGTKAVVNKKLWFDKDGLPVDSSKKRVVVKIGLGENDIRIGDIMLLDYDSNGRYDHTALFLGDNNGNGILDADDNIVTSCHNVGSIRKNSKSWWIRTWENILGICGIEKKNVDDEKRLTPETICNYDVQYELDTKPNIGWVIRRFI